ncbi:hypothetical protein Ancab_039930 [Ancistrocladus abbreviatus]
MHPAVSVASWMDSMNEFSAGIRATVLVLPKDAFGNNVPTTKAELNSYTFDVSASYTNGLNANVLSVTSLGWNNYGYLRIEFIAATAGNLLLHIKRENQTLRGSPLPFKVNPGPLAISKCFAQWNLGTNMLQLFSKAEIFIHQLDQFGNLVLWSYPFDAEVVEQGYCDGSKSIINGSGLNSSVAGEVVKFSVYLNDRYLYPSPIELGLLQVQITQEADSYSVLPSIYAIETINGSRFSWQQSYNAVSHVEVAPAPAIGHSIIPAGASKVLASAYEVIYTPEKSGFYDIHVLCGNIPLNDGHSFKKEVRAGEVNISLSGVVKYAPKVQKQMKNEISVQLMDSFYNPVMWQQSKLNLEIGSINNSHFLTWPFVDNNDGYYIGHYLVKDVGTYELCASFGGNRFLPCPFGVNAYGGEYFPKAYDDSLSVWEDESVAFDALGNDYFAGGHVTVVELSHNGKLFRYTPYKGFYGTDFFSYKMSDVNGNVAAASVNISVLSIPPQFVSFQTQLQATEDMVTPKFGGFPGFEITYPDLMENISITLNAELGAVTLSPMLMQFWQPIWDEFSVTKEVGKPNSLTLAGHVEMINIALQSIQYLGYFVKRSISLSSFITNEC